MSAERGLTKENLDICLKKLAKEFRKLNGIKMPAEIILIGGAAVLINYGFRDMTYDVDAIIQASTSMKDAINKVGDEMGLPNGWLNSDFKKTKSYSPKLIQYSKYYKRFSNILEIRTISGEYLVAMKLMSGRKYKNDISDIVGILYEHKKSETPITLEMIRRAVNDLYESWDNLPSDSKRIITEILQDEQLESLYAYYRNEENYVRESLLDFENDYPGAVNQDNVNEIIDILKNKKNKV